MNRGISGANLPALRSHNAALVLDLLRVAGESGISRLELAERTGLTPQAVSKITARLREEGLAAEAGRRASTGGKPRTVLRLVRRARSAVGLHLDRDELTAVLTDLTGEPIAVRTAPFDFGARAADVLDTAVAEVRALLREGGPVIGVGLACPGPLDHRGGVLGRVTGLPHWNGYPLRDALAERLGLPVVLDKDTNAAALGLALRGAATSVEGIGRTAGVPGATAGGTGTGTGTGTSTGVGTGVGAGVGTGSGVGASTGTAESFAYLHLGTGLGAGLVLGGGLYRGDRTGAGEFGHQVVQLDGPPCECGNRGCIEALCLAAVARGDTVEAARVLGTGAANLVGLLDIDRVLLGGRTAVAEAEVFVRGVATVLAERAARDGAGGGRTVPVALAPHGERAVAYGAAQLVLAPLFGHAEPIRPSGSMGSMGQIGPVEPTETMEPRSAGAQRASTESADPITTPSDQPTMR
ncbi:ROK family transcriptional regulator [Streptomyces sp. NPDC004647]|uniref:ROK family transcriptional regulator n=1 Tax=Streptomyces sp. NPDC004647 TaxID=3154671 RepID=UPI0033ABA3E8